MTSDPLRKALEALCKELEHPHVGDDKPALHASAVAAHLRSILAAHPGEALREAQIAAYVLGREKSFAQGNQGLKHEYMARAIVEAEELFPEPPRQHEKGCRCFQCLDKRFGQPAPDPKETRYICRGCGRVMNGSESMHYEEESAGTVLKHSGGLGSASLWCGPVEPEEKK